MALLAVPFHFATSFLVTVVSLVAVWLTQRRSIVTPGTGWSRLGFGVGWALLGVAEVLHGAQIAQSDLDISALSLRAAGYALIALSLMGRPGKGAQASAAAPAIAGGGPALLSFLSAAAAAWLALRSRLEGARRLALGMAVLAASEVVLATGSSATSGEPGWYAGHGARLVGGLVIASWLWRAVASAIQIRFVVVFLALLLLVVIGISSAMTQVFASNITQDALARAARDGELQRQRSEEEVGDLLTIARQLALSSTWREWVTHRDVATLQARVEEGQRPGGIFDFTDFLGVVDSSGAVMAVSATGPNETANLDDTEAVSVAGSEVVRVALDANEAGSVDLIGPKDVAVIAAYPVVTPPSALPPGAPPQVSGAVFVGRVIDGDYLQALKRRGIQEAFLVTPDRVLAGTTGFGDSLVEGSEMRRVVFDEEDPRIFNARTEVAGVDYFSAYVPLKRADNRVIAALVVSQRSDVLAATEREAGRTIFLLSLLATGIAVAMAYLSGSRITRPLRDLTEAAEHFGRGDLSRRVRPLGSDEVGTLARTFNEMAEAQSDLTNDLRSTADQELQMRSRLETILHSMTDGVVAVDRSGNVVAVNREAERILGVQERAMLGASAQKHLHLLDREGNPAQFALTAPRSLTGFVKSGAGRIPVALTSAPINDNEGGVIGGVAVLRDLTAEHQVERMKTEFLSNISHELNTPLTPILGYADLLRRRDAPRWQVKKMSSAIHESADRLQRIVKMLVDFSSMEAGRLVIAPAPVDVAAVVNEVVANGAAKSAVERKGFRSCPRIRVDPGLFPAALRELLDNALKFSPEGGKIVIACVRLDDGIAVSVIDRGIGISPEDLDRIRQEFVQVDATATRAFGGMGLGLPYVQRIVEGHGGRLEVDSKLGKGSTFTMVFPATSVVNEETAAETTKSGRQSSNRRSSSR